MWMITKQSQPRAIAISSPRISSTSPFPSLLLHDAQKCERHKNQLHRFILTFMKQNGISVCVNLCCLENYISVRHHLLGFHSVVGRSLLFFHLPLVHRIAKKEEKNIYWFLWSAHEVYQEFRISILLSVSSIKSQCVRVCQNVQRTRKFSLLKVSDNMLDICSLPVWACERVLCFLEWNS